MENARRGEIRNLYLTISRALNVIRLKVSMQHIMVVHFEKAFGYLVQTVFAEIF